MSLRTICAIGLLVALNTALPATASAQTDPTYPPGMDEVRVPSHGSVMNGVMFLAGGAGTHPVVVMLHGFPGYEQNHDIAHAVLLAAVSTDGPDNDPAMHAAMERALKQAGAQRVQNVTYDDDHAFSANRVALSELIVRWLGADCAAVWISKR